jgi:hypothetical protein
LPKGHHHGEAQGEAQARDERTKSESPTETAAHDTFGQTPQLVARP